MNLNGGATPIVGGKCSMCKQTYEPGGPHLILQHCISSLRQRLDVLVKLNVQKDQALEQYELMSRMIWTVADKLEAKELEVPFERLNEMPKRAFMRVVQDSPNKRFLLQAKLKPEVAKQ